MNVTDRLKRFTRRKTHELKFGKQVFLVYSMGKVGSTTVYEAIKDQCREVPVFHVHFLSDFWLKEKLPQMPSFLQTNLISAQRVFEYLEKNPDRRLKIITMVREPLIREISDVFQNWKGLMNIGSIDQLSSDRIKKYIDENNHDYVLSWFDTELKAYLKFDIYTKPFDKQSGYSIYHCDRFDLLVMQLEKMNNCLTKAFAEFTGLRINVPSTANSSEMKEGKSLYQLMKNSYKAGPGKIRALYGSRYVRHFYSDSDIEGFIKKWS